MVVLSCNLLVAQDTKVVDTTNSYGFRLIPSIKKNIYGLAFGLLGSDVVCNNTQTSSSHGINAQVIGQGIFIPLNWRTLSYKQIFDLDSTFRMDSITLNTVHNGLILSTFGTMTGKVNGVSICGLSSYNVKLNGVSVNLFQSKTLLLNGLSLGLINESFLTKGVQIGIVNKSKKLKGFQVGVWNVNDQRSFPFINWSF